MICAYLDLSVSSSSSSGRAAVFDCGTPRTFLLPFLDASFSVLNLTRMQVIENQRSIMDLIIVIQKLDKIRKIGQSFEQNL